VRLSKRSEYGLMAAVRLAQQQREGGGYLRSRQIAEEEGLPAKFLEAILLALKSAGILESKVGAGGGYRFSRRPEEVRLTDLVSALEPSTSNLTDDNEGAAAGTPGQRSLNKVNEMLTQALHDSLGSLTVGALMDFEDERISPRRIESYSVESDSTQQREAAL